MSRIDITISARLEKRRQLEAAGVVVHPHSFTRSQTVAQARQAGSGGTVLTLAGRLTRLRQHGKLTFADLSDQTGAIQLQLTTADTAAYHLLSLLDAGDHLGVTGTVGTSKTGELTVFVTSFTVLSKALRPLLSEFNAAEDKEARFRHRHLDLLVNQQANSVVRFRFALLRTLRRFLEDVHDFIEVETPIFQPLYGGTNAKPFVTYMHALDTHYYLRLAPELYLKRLIVGGFERIFEIARNFRNEGVDQTHQPEFTMIEWYEAYADYQRMMDVCEALLRHLAHTLLGSQTLLVGDRTIDLATAWPRLSMTQLVNSFFHLDWHQTTDEEIQALLQTHQIELVGEYSRGKALFALFDKKVAETLIDPTWVLDYPREVSPLAKTHRLLPDLVERYELYIGGKELADGWSEITDPLEQRERFTGEQQRMRDGDEEAHPIDEDFLETMEYGMPPLGGIGIGIDRLVMFLTNTWSIREVIAFPTLRMTPRQQQALQLYLTAHPDALGTTRSTSPNKRSSKKPTVKTGDTTLPARQESIALLEEHIKNPALLHHCRMVASAMQAYAEQLGEDPELWYQTGLLHDLDWEERPDEHPNVAIQGWLLNYPPQLRQAVAAHAPERTGVQPATALDKYLFACDELSGFLHAVSLLRPTGFVGMEFSSVKKKLKDKSFAAAVSRDDINNGAALIGKSLEEHAQFLVGVFRDQT